jgi:hypothetical protein
MLLPRPRSHQHDVVQPKEMVVRYLLKRFLGTLIVGAVIGAAAIAPLRAQTQTEVSDAKLESFVVAAVAVNKLMEEWSPRIQEAQNENEANTLRQQAQSEFVEAVEQTEGITLDEYQMIGQAAQQDPALNARIQKIYQTKIQQ